jgi:arginine-tRNA-protein transferase
MSLPPPVSIRLTTLPSYDCNYLPGRVATTRGFRIERLPPGVYDKFMNAGFRRSGLVVYQPVCQHCRECVPIRVPVDRFSPNKSQRRCARTNADLVVTEGLPDLTDEKLELYRRYITQWHGKQPGESEQVDRESVEAFLDQSPVDTREFCYRTPAGKLVGVGIVDVSRQVLSSVYFYFDPAESSRGLGTYSALYELDWAKRRGISFYHMGFWIRDCDTMKYKERFQPAEMLGSDGAWYGKPEIHDSFA